MLLRPGVAARQVLAGDEQRATGAVAGELGQDHAQLPDASFYITEDQGPELARRIAAFAAGAR